MKPIFRWSFRLSIAALAAQLVAPPCPASAQSADDARKAVKETSNDDLRLEYQRRFDQRTGKPQPPATRGVGSRGAELPTSRFDEGMLVKATRDEARQRVIYDTDYRTDWYDIKSPAIKALARASVALFKPADIQIGSSGAVELG